MRLRKLARGPGGSRPPRPRARRRASNRFGPIASTVAASGATIRTRAPRRRSSSASAAAPALANARTAPRRSTASRGEAVGLRHSTSVPLRTGAASRLAALHAPPSTYSRPPIVTGRNTHGTAHEASTASATRAARSAGRAEDDAAAAAQVDRGRRAGARRTRCGSRSSACRSRGISRVGRRPRPQDGGPQRRAGGLEPGGDDGRERRGERERRGRRARRPARARAPRRRSAPRAAPAAALPLAGHAARRLGPPPRREDRGHDRARRRADERLALAQVPAGLGLEPGEQRPQPRLAERAAAAEHEDVGSDHAATLWHAGARRYAVRDNVRRV